jgi:LmbE family N-acetylglucosaminyl deacetylase
VALTDGARELVPLLEQLRPDTIVTFGPEGMTGHGDHQAISAWVTEAWRLTGRRSSLWYATLTPEFHEEWGALNEQVGLWPADARPPVTPHEDLVAHLRLDDELLALKHRALQAHASQTRPLEELVGSDVYRDWWSSESFVAAS